MNVTRGGGDLTDLASLFMTFIRLYLLRIVASGVWQEELPHGTQSFENGGRGGGICLDECLGIQPRQAVVVMVVGQCGCG
jgi:hypothetical protein